MKIFCRFKCSFLIWVALLFLASTACQEEKWDEYYSNPADRKGAGVFETIASNPEYSEFVSLLKIAGLDSVLSGTGQFTVLAVKNGSLGNIDIANKTKVKKIMDMHVLPITIYRYMMNMYKTTTLYGKNEIFEKSSVLIKVGNTTESISIASKETKVSDGIIYEVEKYIVPIDNLLDALAGNPNYSIFYDYIISTRFKQLDKKLSPIVAYDSIAQPIYDSIFTYRYVFFDQANLTDESGAYTIFVPKNDLVNRVLNTDINSPWGGTFPYSTFFASLVKDRLFKSCIMSGIYKMADLSATNKLRTISGITLNLNKNQIAVADKMVSNGVYHELSDITMPDYISQVPLVADGYLAYPTRDKESAVPYEMPLSNFANGSALLSKQVPNKYDLWYAYPYYFLNTAVPPVIQYRANFLIYGTSSFWYPYNFINPSATSTAALTGTAITFTLPAKYSAMTSNANSFSTHTYRIDFVGSPGTSKVIINTFSALPRGWYKVVLSTGDSDNSGIFDISYGSTVLLKDFDASNPYRNRPNARQQISLGTIYNPAYGKIPLTITLRNMGLNKAYQLELDAILFTAVPEP